VLRIHWWDVRKGKKADGRLLPRDSAVMLRSQHHLDRPVGYYVYELVPKVFHKLRGDKRVKYTHSDAFPSDPERPTSVFWSEEFGLSGPGGDQVGEVVYEPKLEDCNSDNQEGFKVRCGNLSIQELLHGKRTVLEAQPTLASHLAAAKLGKASKEADWLAIYEAYAVVDPKVEISLLQGDALLRQLNTASGRYLDRDGPGEPLLFAESLSEAVLSYFAGLPLSDGPSTATGELDAIRPLRIEVGVPTASDLRGAFSVKVLDEEHGHIAISAPVFLTAVRGEIIATDIPAEMLSDQSLATLASLVDASGNVVTLAQREGATMQETWDRVVMATDELGAGTVEDAVALVASVMAIA
jgi:hypothetical protein